MNNFLGKMALLALCLSISPLIGMQPKKEVKEYTKSWVERHPIAAAASVLALATYLINDPTPSKEAADRASNPVLFQSSSCVRVGGGEIRDCYTGMLIDKDTFEALERDRRREEDIYDII